MYKIETVPAGEVITGWAIQVSPGLFHRVFAVTHSVVLTADPGSAEMQIPAVAFMLNHGMFVTHPAQNIQVSKDLNDYYGHPAWKGTYNR